MKSRSLTRPQGNGGRSRPSQSWSPPAQRGHSTGRFEVDKLGCLHHVVPHTGALHVFNRASCFHTATSTAHASDLATLFREVPAIQKRVVSLLVNGGPDFSPKHMINFLAYGRLWRDQRFDALIMNCHSPGNSTYNDIEHAWSPLSKALAGVTLPDSLPGELPPQSQKLSAEDTVRKEAVAGLPHLRIYPQTADF